MSLRIGLPMIGSSAWHGGVTYVEAILRAIRTLPKDEQPELWLLMDMPHEKTFSLHNYLVPLMDGVIAYGSNVAQFHADGTKIIPLVDFQEIEKYVDFIFPVNSDCLPGFAYASWIPDLQYKHLPQFFSSEDVVRRDKAIGTLVEVADTIIVSSQCTKKDFENSYPGFEGHIYVVPFYSRFEDDIYSVNPASIAQSYGLPDRYVICCNQFWQHKNHDNLFKALAQTKRPVHLVCTGGESDYRNADWFPYLRRLLVELGVEFRVTILGFIPRSDQIQLMRQSIGIIQPSFFEGWSTVLEDARGLGKRVLASDIDVHREQAVPHTVYFDPRSANEIAVLLDELDTLQDAGADQVVEQLARNAVSNLQIAAARFLIQIGNESVVELATRKGSYQGAKAVKAARYLTAELKAQGVKLAEKEAVINELTHTIQAGHDVLMRQMEEKEAIINKQTCAIQAYRLAYWPLRAFLPSSRVIERVARRCVEIFRPRLGNLDQYSPRPLVTASLGAGDIRLTATPKFSIVTPSFQQGDYIERTIQSVLDQGYPNLEYFVQDGGSKDSTVEILKKYEHKLSGWRSKKDSGQSQAINRGFANTNGEIMGWLNSDDLLLPNALAVVAAYFNRHPEVDVVYGNRLLIDEKDMEIGRWIMPGHDSSVLSWADFVPQETMFWRRRIWDKVGGKIDESFRFGMDWDLIVRFRDAGAKFAHIPRFLGAFRIHEHQKTSAAINEIGRQEMDQIRERLLGRVPSHTEIRKAIFLFALKHVVVDMVYRVKTRLRGK